MNSKQAETAAGERRDKHLASHTPPGSDYPPYVSINYRNTMVEITVRSEAKEDGSCGSVATTKMNLFHFEKLIDEAREQMCDVQSSG